MQALFFVLKLTNKTPQGWLYVI